ncbi:MAG: hypothetical protein HOP07_07050 [Bacteriovoracaceae bacterium]|nr:hypothetical protein [Bacteriovoracaceae bacterium]
MNMNILGARALLLLFTIFFLPREILAEDSSGVVRVEFKGQKKSMTSWGNLPTESFLSFSEWKRQADFKLGAPEWEQITRERNNKELVGRIYQCIGSCRVDRGAGFFNGTHRSGLYEGDEIQTVGDSYAWIFLLDGTMVRMSPQSSLTVNEFNIGIKENFINARINTGNILWLSRAESTFEENNHRETDVLFFPYAEYESLPIKEQKAYLEDDLLELVSPKETYLYHVKNLNLRISENNKITKSKPTYAFLVLPNATLMGLSPSVEMVSLIGGSSYIKKRSAKTLGHMNSEKSSAELFLQMRGYDNKELTTVLEDQWITIDEKGRNTTNVEAMPWLDVGEFITKRIPSIYIGREIFLQRYGQFVFGDVYDPLKLAQDYGYRLWGKMKSAETEPNSDLDLRLEFLKEYFRRIETTNLLASGKFKERLESRGETIKMTDYGRFYFLTALNQYYRYGELQIDNISDISKGEVLNSTKKLLWKKMHGIR